MTGKVIRFLPGGAGRVAALVAAWGRASAAGADGTAPVRVTVGEPVRAAGFPEPRFGAVDVAWFADVGAALRHAARLAADGPAPGTCTVVAEEVVARGADHLRARWAAGGDRYTMVSFGRRHPSLTAEAFSARWRAHAGRLGADAIPADVRGSAYVQDHPVRAGGREWPFDAVNAVYLDSLDDLRRRRDWFAARQAAGPGAAGADVLMAPGEAWSLYLVEHVVR